MNTYKVKVNRKQTAKQALRGLGYKKYVKESVVKTFKNEGKVNCEIELFYLGKYATNKEVEQEYKKRDLVPDFYATVAFLKKNPEILEEKKCIGVNYSDNKFANFRHWVSFICCKVVVDSCDAGWDGRWWFAGLRKSDLSSIETKPSELDTLSLALETVKKAGYVIYKQV